MFFRFKLFNRRIAIYSRRVQSILGVNSNLKDGNHIIMLDCDDVYLADLKEELRRLQIRYRLPSGRIASTGRFNSWHVYYWVRLPFREALTVAVDCKYCDWKYIYFSTLRKHFTLRVSDKAMRKIVPVDIVHSYIDDTSNPDDIASAVKYETASRVKK